MACSTGTIPWLTCQYHSGFFHSSGLPFFSWKCQLGDPNLSNFLGKIFISYSYFNHSHDNSQESTLKLFAVKKKVGILRVMILKKKSFNYLLLSSIPIPVLIVEFFFRFLKNWSYRKKSDEPLSYGYYSTNKMNLNPLTTGNGSFGSTSFLTLWEWEIAVIFWKYEK